MLAEILDKRLRRRMVVGSARAAIFALPSSGFQAIP